MTNSAHLPMFILDVLRHDAAEQVASIVKLLNDDGGIGWRDCWPRDFNETDVITTLPTLVEQGYVEQLLTDDNGNLATVSTSHYQDSSEVWYKISQRGYELWEQWNPPL